MKKTVRTIEFTWESESSISLWRSRKITWTAAGEHVTREPAANEEGVIFESLPVDLAAGLVEGPHGGMDEK